MKPVAVLDTNQWVSACLKRVGVPARIIGLALDDRIELLTSPEIWEELINVLRRPRVYRAILRHNVAVGSWLEDMRTLARWTAGRVRVNAVPSDPDDNIVIACALEGRADFVVTGDRHLLSMKHYRGISIVSPRQFLNRMTDVE